MDRLSVKMLLRSIRSSLGRFLSILGIVALGVGFFAGLKSSYPAMHGTADRYLRAQHFHDFRLLSSLGFTEADREAFAALEGVSAAEGAYFADAFVEQSGRQKLCHLMSLTGSVDVPVLTAGRMPRKAEECLADSRVFSEKDLGTTLTLADSNRDDTLSLLRRRDFTIVGLARSPRYISGERGDTELGGGRIDAFVFLLPECFEGGVYHELLLWCDLPGELHSEEYAAAHARMERPVRTLQNELGAARQRTLRGNALRELSDAQKEINDGWRAYSDEKRKTEKELADARVELDNGRAELEDGQKKLDEGRAALESGMAQIPAAWREIEANRALLDEKRAELDEGRVRLEAARYELEAGEAALRVGTMGLEAEKAVGSIPDRQRIAVLQGEIAALQAAINAAQDRPGGELLIGALQARLAEKQAALAEAQAGGSGQADFSEQEAALAGRRAELESGRAQLAAAEAELAAGEAAINEGYAQLEAAEAQLASAERDYPQHLRELEDGQRELDEARVRLEEGEAEYESGLKSAEEGFAEAEAKLRDAQRELDEARGELDGKLSLELYALDRESNQGYLTFDNDTRIIDALSDVFPIFFVLVAALVCITTMTRMVGEERTLIGTLKALGYSAWGATGKYLLYASLSALLGCVLGYFLGTVLIPYFVWFSYGIIYDYARLEFYFSPLMYALCLAVTVPGALLVTWLVCRRSLRECPAELMRPKAPKAGRRILLERIGPLWRALPFLSKLSLRNAFRFPLRVAMLLLGIGGCTALLVAGLGSRDSIAHISSYQYGEIMLYELEVNLDPDKFASDAEAEALWEGEDATGAMTRQEPVTILYAGGEKSSRMIAADSGALEGLISLHDDGGELPFPGPGEAVVTRKIAESCSLRVGDDFTLRTDEGAEIPLRVTGVCENYLRHYVFLNLASLGGTRCNAALLRCGEGTDAAALGARLRAAEGVSYVTLTQTERALMEDSMRSMDVLIALVVVCSGALAFITLYNLTNINIMERVREIATVKVLGFYPRETAAYVLRENLLLSFLGAALGLLLGKGLHLVIIRALVVDYMSFDVRVAPLSYVLAFVTTLLFTVLTNAAMRGKLEKVDMAESLKSVE